MFNLNNDIICQIICSAKEINIEADLAPAGNLADEGEDAEARSVLAEDKCDLTSFEVKDVINELEPDQQKELIALMLVGRGDYEKNKWHDALREASQIPSKDRADFLLSKTSLADFLAEGLAKFGYTCEE